MNDDDFSDKSDSSDEDYVPDVNKEEVVSEVDSDGDFEEPLSDDDSRITPKRRLRTRRKDNKRKRLMHSQEKKSEPVIQEAPIQESEEDKKKKEDDLWADFMRDTGFKSRSECIKSSSNTSKTIENKKTANSTDKDSSSSQSASKKSVKITKIFEFAGEEVKVETDVPADSVEARLFCHSENGTTNSIPSHSKAIGGMKGINSVLSQLGKKAKITTLEKSKLDWDKYKRDENIDEELQTHNKGKQGYLEKQDFLERADLRRFEIEKEFRTIERNKRFNATQ